MRLEPYLRRIAFEGALRPTLETLRGLHRAHATAIPFENLDVQMGLPISLDLEALEDKLVVRRRGGYCFEQNTLFQAVLRGLGFDVEAFEARVRVGGSALTPRTHMLLCVRLPEGDFLSDVGFGGQGTLLPVPMDGTVQEVFGTPFRVCPEGGLRVLQARQDPQWQDLYAFEPVPRHPLDFEVANWYTSTHPDSRFVRTLTAQRADEGERRILRGLSYTVATKEAAEERGVSRAELVPLLREVFGLDLPADARFRSLD